MWSWLRGKRERPEREVVLYTRLGCHLCVDAHEVLIRTQKSLPFRLRVVDIDTDPELVRQHGEWVPVVTIDGRVHFRGHVNAVLLARQLRGGG